MSRHWHADARAQFLLRPDVEWPLSVDRLAWPSVFYSSMPKPAWESASTIHVDLEREGVDLCLDLGRMRRFYEAHPGLAPDGVFVAVELLSEQEADGPSLLYMMEGNIQCGLWLEPTTPERLPEGSTLLGYDVADAGRTSGLNDCGYTEQEIRDLTPDWAPRLNGFGLFGRLEDAVAFRPVCDARVREHAPFWVYALWRLPVD